MKRLFSILVLICMLCSFISVPVMAEDSIIDVITEEESLEESNIDAIVEESSIEENTTEDDSIEITFDEHIIEVDSLEEVYIEEDVESDRVTLAEHDFTSSNLPRYSYFVSLFDTSYSTEDKAAKLRDYLAERLLDIEQYQDELTLDEYFFTGDSDTSDILYIDLSDFSDFELLVNSSNIASTREIISTACRDTKDKFPRLFWVGNNYRWEYKLSNDKVTRIGFKLNCNTDFDISEGLQPVINEVNSSTAEFDSYVQSIVDLIPESYSDYEKILFVNDYLCTNYKYDVNYNVYDAYNLFKTGVGVCEAYTSAFMAIMDELSIKSDSIFSDEMNHIWNLVELNDKWYHIDVTWNDPCDEYYDTNLLGRARHKYFLLSSERIENIDSYPDNHYGFDADSYGYEFGTEYDNPDVNLTQSLQSPFINLNGTWYNTGYNANTKSCGLYAFNSPDISKITNVDLKNPVYNIGLWRPSSNKYYPTSYSYLAKYNDYILFNTPTSICVFDGKDVAELYIPAKEYNESIYGFTVKANTIYMQLATNPNTDGMKNAVVKTANLVDVIYKDYDGTILSEGFAVEGEDTPDIFIPKPVRSPEEPYEYIFNKWATEDGLTFIAEYTKELTWQIEINGATSVTAGTSTTLTTNTYCFQNGRKVKVDADVIWNSSNPSVATVDENGKVKGVGGGTATITAKISERNVEDSVEVNVVAPIISLKFKPTSTTLYMGDGLDLGDYLTVAPPENTDEINWTSSNEAVATVDENGVVTAFATGRVKITATAVAGNKKVNCSITVVRKPEAIVITGDEAVAQGKSSTLKAYAYYEENGKTVKTKDTISWMSSNESIATVSSRGIVKGINAGTVVITAYIEGSDIYEEYEVTVSNPVKTMTFATTNATLYVGNELDLGDYLTIAPLEHTDEINWTSSNEDVATVDENGVVTAISTGRVKITATAVAGNKKVNCSITVVRKPEAIVITGDEAVAQGKSSTLKAYAYYEENGKTVKTKDTISWMSSDESIATVSSRGLVKGINAGTVIITAYIEGTDIYEEYEVNVSIPAKSVKFSIKNLNATVGDCINLKDYLTISPLENTDELTWSTSKKSVATVEDGSVTIVGKGTVKITAKAIAGKKSAYITIKVK